MMYQEGVFTRKYQDELLDNLDGDGIIITDRELIAMYEEHKND